MPGVQDGVYSRRGQALAHACDTPRPSVAAPPVTVGVACRLSACRRRHVTRPTPMPARLHRLMSRCPPSPGRWFDSLPNSSGTSVAAAPLSPGRRKTVDSGGGCSRGLVTPTSADAEVGAAQKVREFRQAVRRGSSVTTTARRDIGHIACGVFMRRRDTPGCSSSTAASCWPSARAVAISPAEEGHGEADAVRTPSNSRTHSIRPACGFPSPSYAV